MPVFVFHLVPKPTGFVTRHTNGICQLTFHFAAQSRLSKNDYEGKHEGKFGVQIPKVCKYFLWTPLSLHVSGCLNKDSSVYKTTKNVLRCVFLERYITWFEHSEFSGAPSQLRIYDDSLWMDPLLLVIWATCCMRMWNKERVQKDDQSNLSLLVLQLLKTKLIDRDVSSSPIKWPRKRSLE